MPIGLNPYTPLLQFLPLGFDTYNPKLVCMRFIAFSILRLLLHNPSRLNILTLRISRKFKKNSRAITNE